MKRSLIFFVIITCLHLPGSAFSETIVVPEDAGNIQGAIDQAEIGDTVLVLNGIYNENVDLGRELITVTSNFIFSHSQNDIVATIINGRESGSCVSVLNNRNNPQLIGFTLTKGSSNRGGGFYSEESNPFVSNCIIRNNYASSAGGGVACYDSEPVIRNCRIIQNDCLNYGGGIRFWNSAGVIDHCIVRENTANQCSGIEIMRRNSIITHTLIADNTTEQGGFYGSLYLNSCEVQVHNCTIVDNNQGLHLGNVQCELINCIIWENGRFQIGAYVQPVTLSYSDVGQRNLIDGMIIWGEGNIEEDPLFADIGNYYLTEDSPCIDAGDPEFPPDLDGTIIDMGAYFFRQVPQILVETDSIDFGDVDLENEIFSQQNLIIRNQGRLNLTIDEMEIQNECFDVDFDEEIIIEQDAFSEFELVFTPPDTGYFTGQLTIHSNDPFNGTREIVLNGRGVLPNQIKNSEDIISPINCSFIQANPNPFNAMTEISYSIPKDGNVLMQLFDIKGRMLETILDNQKKTGLHTKELSFNEYPSGFYFLRIETSEFNSTIKLVLEK